jgi:hypothetical protein
VASAFFIVSPQSPLRVKATGAFGGIDLVAEVETGCCQMKWGSAGSFQGDRVNFLTLCLVLVSAQL